MYPGTFSQSTPDTTAILLEDPGESVTHAEPDERSTRLARGRHVALLGRADR